MVTPKHDSTVLPDGRILLRKDNPAWGPMLVDREAIVQMAVAIERREKM